jgi:hypothetical protein
MAVGLSSACLSVGEPVQILKWIANAEHPWQSIGV